MILLNVLVEVGAGLERVGKKDVILVCVPNPALPGENAGPVPFLIRHTSSPFSF